MLKLSRYVPIVTAESQRSRTVELPCSFKEKATRILLQRSDVTHLQAADAGLGPLGYEFHNTGGFAV